MTQLGMQGTDPASSRRVELTEYVQHTLRDGAEVAAVRRVAHALLRRLNERDVLAAIDLADQPGISSAVVQNAFLEHAAELGFASEKKGLFVGYDGSALRPDYYLPINNTGVLLEVERGKTTTNNMDLLDFWKCHICAQAHYLFLMVPKALRHNPTMTPKKEYASVVRRLRVFFDPGNYTNVRGLFIFGY